MCEAFCLAGDGVLSLADAALAKVTILICNNLELKREILYTPITIREKYFQSDYKSVWNEIVKKKAVIVLRKLRLPEAFKEKVMVGLLLIGMRMVIWAEYHEGILEFSREFSVHFLSSSFFTPQGMIDNRKAAEKLMVNKILSIDQKYKVACLYSFTSFIPDLYSQLSKEDRKKYFRTYQPGLIKFWSHDLIGELDKIKEGKTRDQYLLEEAVKSGIKAAVENSFQRTNLKITEGALVSAAEIAVRNRWFESDKDARFVFQVKRCHDNREAWVPRDYCEEILFFLLSQMREDQQIEFLKADIQIRSHDFRTRVLEYLLNWPYQNYFMKTAKLMWEFLPERNYANLLLKICDRIEPSSFRNIKYGEEKSYDYRKLLMEFWEQSPERHKIFVFFERYIKDNGMVAEALLVLLKKLLTLKNFTREDEKNIKSILAFATEEEKGYFFSSGWWRRNCIELMKEEKWNVLDRIVSNCFSSSTEADKFKRGLMFTKGRSYFPSPEASNIPEGTLCTTHVRHVCVERILSHKQFQAVDKFAKWCLTSEEEIKTFKKELFFMNGVIDDKIVSQCADQLKKGKLDIVTEFIKFALLSKEEIKKFKNILATEKASHVCAELITDNAWSKSADEEFVNVDGTFMFEGGIWEEVEKFLTWCFSSEKEISEFKREKLFKEQARYILHRLIQYRQWEEVETLFAWLGLSADEIKELKKETLFHDDFLSEFREIMSNDTADFMYTDFGGKLAKSEILLRWYLTDNQAVLEFSEEFKRKYQEDKDESVLKNFDLIIAQRLNDLENENIALKRKSEAPSSSKRLCL